VSRFTAVRPAFFAALGAAIVLVAPVAAQAAPQAPTAIAHASTAPAGVGGDTEYVFSGLTYPDTPAGGGACETQGEYLVSDPGSDTLAFNCTLNNPDAGVYNLWQYIFIGSCRYCVKGDSGTAAIADGDVRASRN
jgi:hypothetical protein